jgi:hypothetical protein
MMFLCLGWISDVKSSNGSQTEVFLAAGFGFFSFVMFVVSDSSLYFPDGVMRTIREEMGGKMVQMDD